MMALALIRLAETRSLSSPLAVYVRAAQGAGQVRGALYLSCDLFTRSRNSEDLLSRVLGYV